MYDIGILFSIVKLEFSQSKRSIQECGWVSLIKSTERSNQVELYFTLLIWLLFYLGRYHEVGQTLLGMRKRERCDDNLCKVKGKNECDSQRERERERERERGTERVTM